MNDQFPDDDRTHTYVVLTKGTMVNHYRIVEKIGAGGMGEVYLAEDTKLNRQVALKFLPARSTGSEDAQKRFLNEARAAAGLDHPNICPVYEIDEFDGNTFIVMAYIEGVCLFDKIQLRPLKIDDVIRYGSDIAHGLQEAHEKKIVHRDIKSANILISKKGQARITDFGLARLIDSTRLTKAGTTMGTAAYMSPEQVRGEPVDRRSDIWSLGIVLYEMVTGRLPFRGDREQAVTHQILHHVAEPVTSQRSGVPMELERIIDKCLEKDPSNRYQNAVEVLVDLRRVGQAPVPTKSDRRPWRYLLPVIVIILAIVGFAVLPPLIAPNPEPAFTNPLTDATFRKLTDIEGYKDATISPDGKLVAFVSDHDGTWDIWVVQVETGNIFNRTKGQFGDMRRGLQDVGFSANGSEILSFAKSHVQRIRSMPLFDGPPRKILRDSVIMAYWSPDGTRVVYYTDSPGDPVFVADADGTNSRVVLSSEPGVHQHYQRWSPDGEWIYMNRGRNTVFETDLWRVRPDGSDLEQLTTDQLAVVYPTPITERLCLFVARDADGDGPWIWAVDVETKRTQRLTIGPEIYNSLSASRDGSRLVTSVIKPEANLLDLWRVPILDSIATENNVTDVDLRGMRAEAPRFGRNGLYFMSSNIAGEGLWRQEDGGNTQVWSGARSKLFEVPAISSDGKSIALSLTDEGRRHLYLIDRDGTNLRLVSDSIDVRGSCSFSPDDQWIAVGGYDRDGRGLFKISLLDGHHERLADEGAIHPVWSPRGDLIVYAGEQVSGFSSVEAVRPDGETVDMPALRIWVRGERFRFLPDGSALIYMKGWLGAQDFWLLDLSSMESRRLTQLAKGATMRTFDVSPDGKSIVFDRLRVKTEIYLIELAENAAENRQASND